MSLNALARLAARESPLGDPAPLPDRGEGRLHGICGSQVYSVRLGVVVELEQHIKVVGELRGSLGELRAVGDAERLRGDPGMVTIFGVKDVLHHPRHRRMSRLRQRSKNIHRHCGTNTVALWFAGTPPATPHR